MQLEKALLIFAATLAHSLGAGLDFQVPFYVDGQVKMRSFNTVAGPADGQRLLTGLRLVPSGSENVYIGIDRSTVSRITSSGQVVNESGTKPELADWSMGVTYDSGANRVVLVTLGGEGFLYQRTPAGEWSAIASMQNQDLESLVYVPEENALYGIEVYTSSPTGHARLLKYSPSGEKIGDIQLPAFPVDMRPGDHTAELVAAGGKIIALIERTPENGLAPDDRSRIYVIDPDTATTELTYEKETTERPHAPTVGFTHPNSDGSSVIINTSVTIGLTASDVDGDLSSVELSDGNALLKKWTFDPSVSNGGDLSFTWTPTTLGSHTLVALARDTESGVAEKSVQINVVEAPDPDPEPGSSFTGWYYSAGAAIDVNYTAEGPVDGGTLFRGSHLAKADLYHYLGRDGHTVFHWDNETAVYTETSPSGDFSWPRGTAYDSERNRFLVVTLGGEGFLYAVDPGDLEWGTVSSMENVDVDSIVYHPADDHLYMVENHGGPVRVLRYNAEGKPDGQAISIPDVPLAIGSYYQSRLISAGAKIALLIEPTPGWPVSGPVESRIYMIDPVSRTSALTYRKVWETWPPTQPNSRPVVVFKEPAGNVTVSRGEKMSIVVEVSDADNDLRTATLLLAGTTLRAWTFSNAQGTQMLSFEFTPQQVGTAPLYVRATDAKGNHAEAAVQLTVTDTAVSFVGWYYKDQQVIGVDYTEKGPRDGGTLYRGHHVAQAGYRYLGRDGHTIFRWDNENDEYTVTAPSGEFSWPRGTTWDHRRNRFLVVTLVGEGFLYGVDPVTLQWTTIASMNNVDVDSIVYHHVNDRLYMVANGGGGFVRILPYDAQGNPVGQAIRISDVPLDVGSSYRSRLISTGSKLALLIEPTAGWPVQAPVESRIYIIDPVTGASQMTYRKVWDTWPPRPQTPTVTVVRDLPESYTPGASLIVRLQATPTAGVNAWAVEEIPPSGWTVGAINNQGTYDNAAGKIKWGPFTDLRPWTLEYTIVPSATSVGSKTFSGSVSVNGSSKPITGDTTISGGSRYHPADAPPQDSRITVNELTAYASAWKSGAQWPRPPATIPISYVTRAGQIWKAGEMYVFDASLAPPACWVPANQQARGEFLAASVGTSEVTRSLSPAFTPGRATTVSVNVRPAAGVHSYAIEERPPAGWTIAQAEGAAVVNGALRYGPFLDGQARTLTYQVVPSTTSTAGEFTGTASFDGSSDGVQGGCVLTAPSGTAEHRDGQVHLRFNATPGEKYILESSASIDSATWTYEATIEGAQSAIELPPVEASASLKFYRLRSVAP